MKIKDVEKQVGISKANIRFYEEEGLIHPARNQENNYREYSEADVEQLQEIKKLRLIGIPVQEIKEIYEDRLTLQEALSLKWTVMPTIPLISWTRSKKKNVH